MYEQDKFGIQYFFKVIAVNPVTLIKALSYAHKMTYIIIVKGEKYANTIICFFLTLLVF